MSLLFPAFGKSRLNFSLTKLKASAIKYSGCVENERENISTGRASFLSLKKTPLPESFPVLPMVRREGGQLEEEDGRKLCRSHGQPLTEKHIQCGYGVTDIFHVGSGFVYLVYIIAIQVMKPYPEQTTTPWLCNEADQLIPF